ncbi:hypothetical protein D918_02378 [Trichuris suis]|nr:hypothetical protein D918_02378 [Trichuris suis]
MPSSTAVLGSKRVRQMTKTYNDAEAVSRLLLDSAKLFCGILAVCLLIFEKHAFFSLLAILAKADDR